MFAPTNFAQTDFGNRLFAGIAAVAFTVISLAAAIAPASPEYSNALGLLA